MKFKVTICFSFSYNKFLEKDKKESAFLPIFEDKKMNDTEIALLFKKARERRGLTQKDVSEKLSYSSQTISLWEIGKVFPKLDSVFAFCDSLQFDPYSFLRGVLVDTTHSYVYQNDVVVYFLLERIEKDNISKTDLEEVLNVSRPTLRKILKGEVILAINQYLSLAQYLNFDVAAPFTLEKDSEDLNRFKKQQKRFPLYVGLSAAGLVLLSAILCLSLIPRRAQANSSTSSDSDFSTPFSSSENVISSEQESSFSSSSELEKIEEEIPSIQVHYGKKKLFGFISTSSYQIEDFTLNSGKEEIDILDSWWDKTIHIKTLARDELHADSKEQTLYLNSREIENSLPSFEDNFLSPNPIPSDLKERMLNADGQVTEEEVENVKNSLSLSLPLLNDSCFSNSLLTITSYQKTDFLYQIKTDSETNQYVEIQGVKDKEQYQVFVPKTIEGISDIRVADHAFSSDKNPKLTQIAFEEKPHYLGDYAFEGLTLQVLDFGKDDDLSYTMNVKYTDINTDSSKDPKYRSFAFKGVNSIDRCRLPYVPSQRIDKYFSALFGDVLPQENPNYVGINALVLPNPITDTGKKYTFAKQENYTGLKVHSLYIPKTVTFKPFYSYDYDLRLVRYEKGYQYLSENYSLSKQVKVDMESYAQYYSYCFALEYIIREDTKEDIFLAKEFLQGCVSFRGSLRYENFCVIGTQGFEGCHLPTELTLKRVNKINANAFHNTYGCNQIDIYKSARISSENPLLIAKDAFPDSTSVSENKRLKKIVFHNFSEEEITFAEDADGNNSSIHSSIAVEYVND